MYMWELNKWIDAETPGILELIEEETCNKKVNKDFDAF
jgi:hypothetical protein